MNGIRRSERKLRIRKILEDWLIAFDEGESTIAFDTVGALAKAMNMTNSNHLKGILSEMVDEGTIQAKRVPIKSGITDYQYIVADNRVDLSVGVLS